MTIRALLLAVAAACLVSSALPGRTAAAGASIGRLRVSSAAQSVEGSAFLAHANRQAEETVYHFVTAAQLLDPAILSERRAGALSLRIDFADGTTIDARGDQVQFAGGLNFTGLAIIRAVSRDLQLVPLPLSFEQPGVGQTFTIHDVHGLRLTEQVRFRSTRLILGDRTSRDVRGLIGAPALIDGRAFGIVTECSTTRVPTVALFAASRGFLSRVIPGFAPVPTTSEQPWVDPCLPV